MTELDLSAVRWFQSIYVDVRLPYRTTLKLDPPSWTTPLPSTDVEVLEGSARMGEPAVEGKIVISLCWSPIPRFEARIVVDVPEDFEPWEVGTELLVRAEHGIYGLDLVVRIDSVAVQQLLFGGIGVSVVGEVRSEFIGELPRDERITSLRLTFANAFLPLGDEAEIELDRIGQPGPKYTCRTASSAFLVDGVAVTVEALAPWNALEYFALVEASESGDPLPFQPDALWLHNRLPTNGYVASLAVELRPTGRGFSRAEVKKWTQATELLLTMATATSCTGIHMEARDARGGVHTQWRLPRSLPAEPLQSWWPRGGATSNEIAASLTTLRAVVDAEYSMTWMPLVASWYVAAVAARDPRSRLIQTQAASELLAWVHLVVERNMSADGFEDMRAADKIRLLLQGSGVDTALPARFSDLRSTQGDVGTFDGVDLVVAARNRAVHPPRSRQPASQDEAGVSRAAELGLSHLEGVMRSRLGWTGAYWDRVAGADCEPENLQA